MNNGLTAELINGKVHQYPLNWQPQSLEREARTFPAQMYTSPEIYQLEKQQIFGKLWFCVGHKSQLQGDGSYFTVDFAEQPLVIVQNKVGELRAFFNVCTHRAGPVAMGNGQANHLTCFYHAWSFDLEGKLRGMPDMEAAEQFDCASHALTSVKVDTWGPFIFVNLDPNCKPLADQFGDMFARFDRYQLNDLVRVHCVDYWADVNWKVYTENTAESYHEPFVHRDTWGKHCQCVETMAEARDYYYLQSAPFDLTDEFTFGFDQGIVIDTLDEAQKQRIDILCLFPNFTLVATPTYCSTFLFDPQGVTKTRMIVDLMVPNTAAALSPGNLEPLIQFYDKLMREDLVILPGIQKAIQSFGYRPGRLSPTREMGVHRFQELVMEHLAGK